MKNKIKPNFASLDGGLFNAVSKADVGSGVLKLQERGVDILAWADPFFPNPSIPENVKKAMIDAIETGLPSHYSMPIGRKELRQAIARKVSRQTGLAIDYNRNVIVTPGSDTGLLYAMMPFVGEGDEVLVPCPSYPSNYLNPQLLGGLAVKVPLSESNNYAFCIDEFEKRVTNKTKAVLITHPNNPTTTVFRKENLMELCEFIIKHDLVLICDQAFEDHIFDDIEFIAPATLEGMWERTLTVCSVSKGIGLSGFRIGYIYACDEIMNVLYGGAVNVLGAAATVTSIGAEVIVDDEDYLKSIYKKLKRRRDFVNEIFSDIKGVSFIPSESGFLTWLNVGQLATGDEMVEYLIENANVLVNSGKDYGMSNHIRIVTGCIENEEEAKKVFLRIRCALEQYKVS